jgi:hypothetical protein
MAHLLEIGGLAGYPCGVILHCVLDFQWEVGDNPWCLFDVLRMDQQHLKRPFEPVEDQFPIVTGTLHRDMRAAVCH